MFFLDCNVLNTEVSTYNWNVSELSDGESYDEISDNEYYDPFEKTKISWSKPSNKTWKPKVAKVKNPKRKQERKLETIQAIKAMDIRLFVSLIHGYVQKLYELNRKKNISADWDIINSKILKKLVNEVLDSHGNTVLHYCAIHSAGNIAFYAMQLGANPCLRNANKKTPYACISDESTKKNFQYFAQIYPKRYNYSKVIFK